MNNNEKIEKVRFVLHSLTRANFIEIMEKQQIEVFSRDLNAIDYDHKLKDKLLEVIQSIVFPQKSNNFLESLVDSLELIFLLAQKQEILPNQIEQRIQEKLLEQGDFETSA